MSVKAGYHPGHRKSQAPLAVMLFSYFYSNWDLNHYLKHIQGNYFLVPAVKAKDPEYNLYEVCLSVCMHLLSTDFSLFVGIFA